MPAGIALDDLIRLGQDIVPAGLSRPQTPANAIADALRPLELAAYLAAQVQPLLSDMLMLDAQVVEHNTVHCASYTVTE